MLLLSAGRCRFPLLSRTVHHASASRHSSKIPSAIGITTPRAFSSTDRNNASRGDGWTILTPPNRSSQLLLGCVSYDPSVSQIWDSMSTYLRNSASLPTFDYVLFSSYEAQVGALFERHIDIAWNGPLAHVMVEDLAAEERGSLPHPAPISLGMRDVDRDFRSVCLVRSPDLQQQGQQVTTPADLDGKTIVTGSSDSPQAHLVPLYWLTELVGVKPSFIISHDLDLGKHGDTARGEIAAMADLLQGKADAALVSDLMYQRGLDGALMESKIDPTELARSVVALVHDEQQPPIPVFDHCSFDALEASWKTDEFQRAIMGMDMKRPECTEAMKMEGIQECWMESRVDPGGMVRAALHKKGLARSLVAAAGGPAASQGRRRAFSTTDVATSAATPTVGVIGAGVAGLQTLRALKLAGMSATAFELSPGVGGLWRENYLSYGVQVPRELYEFTDLPFDEAQPGEFASGKKVKEYIERYARHFDLEGNVMLNTRVVSAVQSDEDGSWTVTTETTAGQKDGGAARTEHKFDKLVVCTGMYSTTSQFLPTSASDMSSFSGEVMHSSGFQNEEQAKGKKILVVGNGKSAVDCATAASLSGAESVTLLSRRPHWPTPRKIADLIPFQYVFLSRLGQSLVVGLSGPLPFCSPPSASGWHAVGQYAMVPIFKVVELLFAAQFRNVTGPTSPFLKAGVVEDFYGFSQVLDYTLRDLVKSGKVDWKIGEIESYDADGVITSVGDRIDADVVVYGTGFKKDYSVFCDSVQKALNVESDGLYLYNHTIPSSVQNLAFVGSELATIMNITSYGIQAEWLAKLWSGNMAKVPTQQEMEEEVNALRSWKRSWMPDTASRASLVLLHQTHFHDRLMRDMGLEPKRKGGLAEFLMPYVSKDYDGVIGHAVDDSINGGKPATQV